MLSSDPGRSSERRPLALVAGASGWLGTRLVSVLLGESEDPTLRSLVEPRRVRCLLPPGAEFALAASPFVEVVRGDLRDPATSARFCDGARGATLFHLAGVIHPQRAREFWDVNVVGTENLLGAAARAGARRAIVTSSNSPFGCNRSPRELFDETTPYRPFRGYGRSKMAAEQKAFDYHRSGRLETTVIRPPWFYGSPQPARQTTFFSLIQRGRWPLVGDGRNLRSMVYLDNLCQGLLLAEQAAAAGQAYWIADSRPYAMSEVVTTVTTLLEREFGIHCAKPRLKLPRFAASIAGFVDVSLQALGLYHPAVHVFSELDKTIACSVDKARRELGYRPTVDLEEGMRRSLGWCLDNGLLGKRPRGRA